MFHKDRSGFLSALPIHREEESPLPKYFTRFRGQNVAHCPHPNYIGINYFRQEATLRGHINDTRNIESFLCVKIPLLCSLPNAVI